MMDGSYVQRSPHIIQSYMTYNGMQNYVKLMLPSCVAGERKETGKELDRQYSPRE